MKKISFQVYLRYKFDNVMSKGLLTLMLWLGIFTVIIILFIAGIVVLLGIKPQGYEELGFISAFWLSLMRTLDPGTMGTDTGWPFRIVMLLVTLIGIFVVSTLIGLVSNSILNKIDLLRKGRSFVVEKNHILILGWSSKIFTIISELVIANENQSDPCVVILAEKDKVEMEDEIRDKAGNLKNTRVICRSGNPIDIADLHIVNPFDTKSIIILDQENVNSDSQIIKTILAITTNRKERKKPYHITAEIKDRNNYEVAQMVGKDEVELILSEVFIALIMVQTGRQSGISVVYTELMDFSGDEIYFNSEASLVGKTFAEAIFAYEDTAVFGIQKSNGTIRLKPELDTVIDKGDKLIGISEDDDTMILSGKSDYEIDPQMIVNGTVQEMAPERILLLGWNDRAKTVIEELNNTLQPGSYLKVVANMDDKPAAAINIISHNLKNLSIEFEKADTTNREVLESLDATNYDHIIVMSYQEGIGIQEADAQTLITLLHLRNISEASSSDMNIVSEMLDLQNRKLADVTKADDFIVSDELLSLVLSQVSENKYLMKVFKNLFGSKHSGIFIRHASAYVKTDSPVNFYTVLESARQKDEVAIGYRILAHKNDVNKAYGVVINPAKSKDISFTEEDMIIVISKS